jgi:hypothetical protein
MKTFTKRKVKQTVKKFNTLKVTELLKIRGGEGTEIDKDFD